MLHTGPLSVFQSSFCKWRCNILFSLWNILTSSSGDTYLLSLLLAAMLPYVTGKLERRRHTSSIITSQLIRQMLRQMRLHLLIWCIYPLGNESKTASSELVKLVFPLILAFPCPFPDAMLQNAHKHSAMEGRPPSASGSSLLMSERCLQLSVHGS